LRNKKKNKLKKNRGIERGTISSKYNKMNKLICFHFLSKKNSLYLVVEEEEEEA